MSYRNRNCAQKIPIKFMFSPRFCALFLLLVCTSLCKVTNPPKPAPGASCTMSFLGKAEFFLGKAGIFLGKAEFFSGKGRISRQGTARNDHIYILKSLWSPKELQDVDFALKQVLPMGLGEVMGTGSGSWDNSSLIYPIPTERPDRPRDLELSDLAERSVRLTWIPGDDNNSPITGLPPVPKIPVLVTKSPNKTLHPALLLFPDYIVQFEEDRIQPGVWHNHSRYPGSVNSAILSLSPYVNYQFRVIAVNDVGSSVPSLPSERYQTNGARESFLPVLLSLESTLLRGSSSLDPKDWSAQAVVEFSVGNSRACG